MWNKLSMADRAKYIQLAVKNGITHLGTIKEAYNKFEEGGDKSYKRRYDVEKAIEEAYPYSYYEHPVNVVQDNNFNSGYGDIETMLKEDAQYGNGYYYENPYPNENTIVFNNNIKNPNNAAILDYLHVLRNEDEDYQKLLQDLHEAAIQDEDNDIMYSARKRREDDINNGREPMTIQRYIENEEDGWLRNMFHPGTEEQMKEDNYYPDKQQLMMYNPSLVQPTKQIYNYLHPIKLPEVIITPEKNKFDEGGDLEAQIREQYPNYNDTQIRLLLRQRQSDINQNQRINQAAQKDKQQYDNNPTGAFTSESFQHDKDVILDSIKSSAESGQAIAKGINNANNAAHQENVEYRQRQQEDYNKWLNAVETATALYGATAQGMEWLSKVPRLSPSVATKLGNVASTLKKYAPASQAVGMAVDGIQLYNSDNTFDTIDNSVEIGLGGLGFTGATDIFRSTSLYGKYGKAIDNAFDISGFIQNNWDIMKNTIGERFVEN